MNSWMEYVLSAFLLVLLFLSTVTYFIPVSLYRATYIAEGQLQLEAEKVLNQLLLSPGDPPDWGCLNISISELKAFGLAAINGESYSLDADKLIRVFDFNLSEFSNIVPINLNDVISILGLKGKYGLYMKLTPALNLSLHKISDYVYRVVVKTHEDIPVVNAKIKAVRIAAYFDNNEKTVTYVEDVLDSVYTDYDGSAILNFTEIWMEGGVGFFMVLYVDFHGFSVVSSFIYGNSGYGVIIGNDLYVGHIDDDFNLQEIKTRKGKPNNPGGGAIHLLPAALIVTPKSIESTVLFDGKILPITPQGGARPYYKFELEGLDSDAVIVAFVIKNLGQYKLVVARRAYNSLEGGVRGFDNSFFARGVHVRRLVKICGFLYYFDIVLWRIVEEG
ncbi:MAG: hypothetical protein QXO82_04885 [Candidatus Methanomethylicia archaeon]